MKTDDYPRHRPNVGVVLFNTEGLVWLGRRTHTPEPWNWQFPQGGVDPGEDLHEAALRELRKYAMGKNPNWVEIVALP